MKNALILHGTGNNSGKNWFPWLKEELENKSWKVYVPDLPSAEKPNMQRYNQFLFDSDWEFNEESVLIGHSSGAVAVLALLQDLPEDVTIDIAVMIGSFMDDMGAEYLSEVFNEPLDYKKIKTKAKKFVFFHSDNDPYCPLEHAKYQSEILDGELIVMPDQAHFSISTAGEKYKKFPELLEILV